MANLLIRNLRPEDYPLFDRFDGALHQMHAEARPDLFRSALHPVPEEQYQKMLLDPCEELFLAEAEGIPAGICALTLQVETDNPLLFPRKSAHVDDLYVAEKFRRMGVGAALYREAERRAKAFGAAGLSLMVWPFNAQALDFYKKMGMEIRSYMLETKL